MTLKPRPDIILIKKIYDDKNAVSSSGLILPSAVFRQNFDQAEVLAIGPNITDISVGDVVIFEDVMQPLYQNDDSVGIINQKYVHMIKEQNV